MHEIGHLLIIKFLGINNIEVSLIFASIKLSINTYLTTKRTAIIAVGGPMMNLILSSFFLLDSYYLQYFGAANTILFIFNMLPISNLDGGDIFKYLCTVVFKSKGLKIFSVISYINLVLLILLGIFFLLTKYNNPTLLIVGIYLLIMSYKKV